MKERDREVIAKFPELFGEPPFDRMKTLIGFGFCVASGWMPVLEKLFQDIQDELDKNPNPEFRIVQVKEKFGGLRVYCDNATDKIHELISDAETQCYSTCETCGKPGKRIRESDGWIRTICEECRQNIS